MNRRASCLPLLILTVALAGCGGGGGPGDVKGITGTVSQLQGTGLTIQLDEGETLVVPAGATSFQFETLKVAGSEYTVSVLQQPSAPVQTCSIENPRATVGGPPVSIVCSTRSFSVGGTVSGLGGPGLVLLLGNQVLPIATDGRFTFPEGVASGARYTVTTLSVPGPQSCSVDKASDTIVDAAVSNVAVTCSNNAANVWAVGQGGTIVHYTGAGWSPVESGTTQGLNAIWGSGPYDVWAVGAGGTILHSDGGAWEARGTGTTANDLHRIWGSGPDDVWAVGAGGTILHWKGAGWSVESSGTTRRLSGVSGTGATDAWAVGEAGTILHWNGSRWAASASGTTTAGFGGVWARSAGEVWAVGVDGQTYTGTVYRWSGSWASYQQTGTDMPSAVWGAGQNEVWAVGGVFTTSMGSIIHRPSSGGAFQTMDLSLGLGSQVGGIWGREVAGAAAEIWVVGTGLILHFDGGAWTKTQSGIGLSGVWSSAR